MLNLIFLHGLDSSGYGTKGRYFSERFPQMLRPDFEGSLIQRMQRLKTIVADMNDLVLVGSSFGGLMGACLAIDQPQQVKRLIMLAPALNFSEYKAPVKKLDTEALLLIGKHDTVTPPDIVIPAAEATFAHLQTTIVDDDHLLHNSFQNLDWESLLK
ncbi:MAG: alpha/beta hydrolase [Desulfobacterales bacterium]|nr:MAG: alpha/beta hydrolase [Desulfobacterales bacterium]